MDEVFGTRAKVRVLRAMSRDPGRNWVERELARTIGMSPSTVNQAVAQLRDLNILESHTFGQASVVRLRSSLHINRLVILFFQREGAVWKRVEKDIRQKMPSDVSVYLYGSTSRGSAKQESDMDFFVLAPTSEKAELAAGTLRRVVQRHFPAPLDVIALDWKGYRSREHRSLVRTVLREGRPLTLRLLEDPR